jgi:hypothetical protein
MAKYITHAGGEYTVTLKDGCVVACDRTTKKSVSLTKEEVLAIIVMNGRPHMKSKAPVNHPEFAFQ